MRAAIRDRANRHPLDLAALGLYALTRLWFLVVVGLKMDLRFLSFGPHLPDVDLLEHRLFETLWYEHTQPPLYSAFVGLLLRLSPFPDGATFLVAHLAMGAVLAVVLRRLFEVLGLGVPATFVALFLVFTNPSLVALELIASYDEPTIVLLALLALKTGRYVASASARDLAWVSALACSIVLVRTVFHPMWFVLVALGVVAMRPPAFERRRAAVLLGAPVIVIVGLILKNAALFDVTGLTSFAGPSLSKIAGAAADDDEVRELQADGTVSALFGRPVFWSYATYEDAMPPCVRTHPDIPALAEPTRRYGGAYPNMNDECMLAVYRQQTDDAVAFIRARPAQFVGAQASGAQMFFEPALPIVFTTNADALRPTATAYRWTLLPQVQLPPVSETEFGALRVLDHGGVELVPTVLLADLAAIVLGAQRGWTLVRRRRTPGSGARRASYGAWAAVGSTCAWVTIVGSLLEINENARYRMLIEPFLLATVVYGGQAVVRWAQRRTSMSRPMSSTGAELVSDPDDTTSAPLSA